MQVTRRVTGVDPASNVTGRNAKRTAGVLLFKEKGPDIPDSRQRHCALGMRSKGLAVTPALLGVAGA